MQKMQAEVEPIMTDHPDFAQKWQTFAKKNSEVSFKVAQKLLEQTTITPDGKKVMQVIFPRHRRGGSLYVGGAHGTLGVFYTIVMTCLMDKTNTLLDREGFLLTVAGTCRDLLAMQDDVGGYPIQRGFPLNGHYTTKIVYHWCHGSPGAIAPFLAATELFLNIAKEGRASPFEEADGEENWAISLAKRLYQAAIKSAQATWDNGLLLKGNSMCHGISGNGLLLHSAARWCARQTAETEGMLGLDAGSLA